MVNHSSNIRENFEPFTLAPFEMIRECFSYLSDEDLLLRISLVCKKFSEIANEESLWKKRIVQHLTPAQADQFFDTFGGWKAAYVNFKQMSKEGEVISSTEIKVNGERHQGNFKNGKLNGEGKLIDEDGITWKGLFTDGYLGSHRIIIFPNGKKAEGDFKNLLLTGKGTITDSDGEVQTGTFNQGILNGPGSIISQEKTIEGNFRDGYLNGLGKVITSARIDEGYFKDGKLHGWGKRTFLVDGRVIEGNFFGGFPPLP